MTDEIARRVEQVKRAAEAQIEITSQLGAELVTAQGELAALRDGLALLTAGVRVASATLAEERVESATLAEERDKLRLESFVMDNLVGNVQRLFRAGYGKQESMVVQMLSDPQRRALSALFAVRDQHISATATTGRT